VICVVSSLGATLSSTITIDKNTMTSKDRILHTNKLENEHVVTIKGDYGQGTPADQHLYTTRGTVDSNSLNIEKKR
jgi:hypothetical protein